MAALSQRVWFSFRFLGWYPILSSAHPIIENANIVRADVAELEGELNIILRRNSALRLGMGCQTRPFHLLSPAVSSDIHFDGLGTKHCGSIDGFPGDELDVDNSAHLLSNAREFPPRSNAHRAPATDLYGNVGTATSDDAPHHVPEAFTIRSYQNCQNL